MLTPVSNASLSSEGDIAAFHHQVGPALRVDPRAFDLVYLSLRDPTGLGASLSNMNRYAVFLRVGQYLGERRHALASNRLRDSALDQVG